LDTVESDWGRDIYAHTSETARTTARTTSNRGCSRTLMDWKNICCLGVTDGALFIHAGLIVARRTSRRPGALWAHAQSSRAAFPLRHPRMTRRRRNRASCHWNVPRLLGPRATMQGLSLEVAALRPPVLILSTPSCQRRQLTSATRHRRSEDIPGLGGSMGMCVLVLIRGYVCVFLDARVYGPLCVHVCVRMCVCTQRSS
jgi:hypothetical protein